MGTDFETCEDGRPQAAVQGCDNSRPALTSAAREVAVVVSLTSEPLT